MRAPKPHAADNREQREQRERPTAKSVLEGLERLQCSRRLDPVVVSPLHSLDAVSQSGIERQQQKHRGNQRSRHQPRRRASRCGVAPRIGKIQIDEPRRFGRDNQSRGKISRHRNRRKNYETGVVRQPSQSPRSKQENHLRENPALHHRIHSRLPRDFNRRQPNRKQQRAQPRYDVDALMSAASPVVFTGEVR